MHMVDTWPLTRCCRLFILRNLDGRKDRHILCTCACVFSPDSFTRSHIVHPRFRPTCRRDTMWGSWGKALRRSGNGRMIWRREWWLWRRRWRRSARRCPLHSTTRTVIRRMRTPGMRGDRDLWPHSLSARCKFRFDDRSLEIKYFVLSGIKCSNTRRKMLSSEKNRQKSKVPLSYIKCSIACSEWNLISESAWQLNWRKDSKDWPC